MRDGTHRALGLSEPAARFDLPARIGIIAEERRGLAGRLRDLRGLLPHRLDLMSPREVFHPLNRPPGGPAGATPDVLVIALDAGKADAEMQILPDLRARAATRYAGVLVLAPENAGPLAAAVLDLGADDVAPADTSPAEIALRVERLVARKRMADRLRSTVREGLRAAVTDPLTGLFNRRYALPHITRISERATRLGRALRGDGGRSRSLQEGQRQLWPCRRRCRIVGAGAAAARQSARRRPGGADRRRGVSRRAARRRRPPGQPHRAPALRRGVGRALRPFPGRRRRSASRFRSA